MQKVAGILLLAIFLYGCSTSRKSNVINIDNTDAGNISEQSIVDRNLTKSNFYIQKAEIVVYNGGETVNLLATLKYQKEGGYIISIRTRSGVEVVRIKLANDTIMANDRINKKLYCGSTVYLENKYGISFGTLPVILGDYISDNDLKEINIDCINGKAEILKFAGNRKIYYLLNCKERKVEVAKFNSEAGEGKIEVKFDNFKRTENYLYPQTSRITDSESKSEIRIEIKKIEFVAVEDLKFFPGVNYEKIILK